MAWSKPFLPAFLAAVASLPLAAGEKLTLESIFAGEPLEGVPPRVSFAPDGSGLLLLQLEGESRVLLKEDWSGAQKRLAEEKALKVPQEEGLQLSLEGYQLSPDGTKLLLQKEGDLFLVNLPSQQVVRLTRSPEPEEEALFSPDGRWLAYVRGGNLFVMDLQRARETQLTQDGGPTRLHGQLDWVYTEELYNRQSRAFSFSPDSRHLLFLSFDLSNLPSYPLVDLSSTHPKVSWLRYPKAGDSNARVSVSVATLPQEREGGQTVTWNFSGSEREYIARFGWLPSSQGFWLLFLDRPQQNAQLVTLSLQGGAPQVVLREADTAWINVEDHWLWTESGSLIFSSERSGFRHLYRLDPGAAEPKPLTQGPWEVTQVLGLSPKEDFLYFVATEVSPLERHLYRVPVAGGPVVRLTSDAGTHALRAAPHCTAFLDSYSTANRWPEVRLLDSQGSLRKVIPYAKPPKLQAYSLGQWEFFTLSGPSGETLYATLLKPADFQPSRRYPVVVYVYGGPHAQVVRNAWGGRTALFHQFLAQEGFLVFSLDNRGSAARGRAFERALLKRLGQKELEDQLAGVAWLAQQPYVDPQRIGIWGWSYGGFMTLYALTHSNAFAAGAAVAPVTDWRLYDTIYTERYLKLPEENPEGYRDSSPLWHASHLAAPLFLAHGTGDDNVHWQNTLNFIGQLIKGQKPYTLHLYPNKDHGIVGQEERLHLFSAIFRHFGQHLLQEHPAP